MPMRKMFSSFVVFFITLLSYQFTFLFSLFCSFMALDKKNCVYEKLPTEHEQVQHAHTKSYSRHSSSSDLYQLIDLTDNGITHGTRKIG